MHPPLSNEDKQTIESILQGLARTPALIDDMLSRIPEDRLRVRAGADSWSIHEHLCHLAAVHPMLNERAQRFIDEEHPVFESYDPDAETPGPALDNMSLDEALESFHRDRELLLHLLRTLVDSDWDREAEHAEYTTYTPLILARHILLHDHVHLYRVEDLWLSRRSSPTASASEN